MVGAEAEAKELARGMATTEVMEMATTEVMAEAKAAPKAAPKAGGAAAERTPPPWRYGEGLAV